MRINVAQARVTYTIFSCVALTVLYTACQYFRDDDFGLFSKQTRFLLSGQLLLLNACFGNSAQRSQPLHSVVLLNLIGSKA